MPAIVLAPTISDGGEGKCGKGSPLTVYSSRKTPQYRRAAFQQVLDHSQAFPEFVPKVAMVGMANLDQQLGALGFQEFGHNLPLVFAQT